MKFACINEVKICGKSDVFFHVKTLYPVESPGSVEYAIPFNKFTPFIKDDLRENGCWCPYEERCWKFSEKKHAAVLRILKRFIAAGSSEQDPDVDATSDATSTPTEESGDVEEESPRTRSPATSTPLVTKDRKSYHRRSSLPFSGPLDLGHGVTMAEQSDRRTVLEGHLLSLTAPMLTAVFGFAPVRSSALPRWVSAWELNPQERTFLEKVLPGRLAALAAGVDQKQPIPQDALPLPRRFRPKDPTGMPLRGPCTSGPNALPHNVGRQFFSNFKQGDLGSFLWADGTDAFSEEAYARHDEWADGLEWEDGLEAEEEEEHDASDGEGASDENELEVVLVVHAKRRSASDGGAAHVPAPTPKRRHQ